MGQEGVSGQGVPCGGSRVAEQLAVACSKMGSLAIEDAFWVLIPKGASPATWISAVGQHHGLSASIRLPGMVMYSPSRDEAAELLVAMRPCAVIIHVHNHPLEPYPGIKGSSKPSRADLMFAGGWKQRLPEVAHKMRFFIVHGDQVVEYSK